MCLWQQLLLLRRQLLRWRRQLLRWRRQLLLQLAAAARERGLIVATSVARAPELYEYVLFLLRPPLP